MGNLRHRAFSSKEPVLNVFPRLASILACHGNDFGSGITELSVILRRVMNELARLTCVLVWIKEDSSRWGFERILELIFTVSRGSAALWLVFYPLLPRIDSVRIVSGRNSRFLTLF